MWIKAPFKKEQGEFERYGYPPEQFEILKRRYNIAPQSLLHEHIWRQLENTDSYNCKSYDQLQKIMKKNNAFRDVGRIEEQFTNKKVECPIVIVWKDRATVKYELVAGNTRLCVARIKKIQPKVIIVDMKDI